MLSLAIDNQPEHGPIDQVFEQKVVFNGTHRCRTPEQTWEQLQPLLIGAGITRVADITQLDSVGLPVYQAIRPHSRSLAVSQGKGLTPMLAKVSAVMESIESWCAEQIPIAVEQRRANELDLPYDPCQLCRTGYSHLAQHLRHNWAAAVDLHRGNTTFVPQRLVCLDWSVAGHWDIHPFLSTSNGLASGNSRNEALVHAICELVERFTTDKPAGPVHAVDPNTLPSGSSQRMADLIISGGHHLELEWFPSPIGLPVFKARLYCHQIPQLFGGYGAHLDADVALSRAISEAAQSRLTHISGARDDLGPWTRLSVKRHGIPSRQPTETITLEAVQTLADQAGLRPGLSLQDDLNTLLAALDHHTLLALDLSPMDGVHVMRVVSPELETLAVQ
jgi:ribosomal protein S12 methylthiotransferase accessory factor